MAKFVVTFEDGFIREVSALDEGQAAREATLLWEQDCAEYEVAAGKQTVIATVTNEFGEESRWQVSGETAPRYWATREKATDAK